MRCSSRKEPRPAAERAVAALLLAAVLFTVTACVPVSRTIAAIALTRSETGAIVAIVRVCSGAANGVQLSTDTDPQLVLGARSEAVTTWTSPDPVTAVGATDLLGATYWHADPEIESFRTDAVYTMAIVADDGFASAPPIVFTVADFDSLSGGEVLTSDPDSGGSRYLPIANFFDATCA